MKKKLVVLTGAGMSAESGIPTFRAIDGLWENHRVEDVASPDGWRRNPGLVLEFYNQRRKNVIAASPNQGHRILAELESIFDIHVVTQNIDDLHERAGSTKVIHLHGEIKKSRSSLDPSLVYDITGSELNLGQKCERGSQLRPHIVWFGEAVPLIELAADITSKAEIFVVAGTSLAVYPAAGLVQYASRYCSKFIIDPHIPTLNGIENLQAIEKGASEGFHELREILTNNI